MTMVMQLEHNKFLLFSPTRTTAHTLLSSLCSGTYTTINCDKTEQGQEMAKRDSGLRGDKGLSMAQFELQQFLGEFARSSKAPINFMSVSPSVRIYQHCSYWTDFLEM